MKGKQVLLTGGTGGLGMGVTAAVLALGAKVTIPYYIPLICFLASEAAKDMRGAAVPVYGSI